MAGSGHGEIRPPPRSLMAGKSLESGRRDARSGTLSKKIHHRGSSDGGTCADLLRLEEIPSTTVGDFFEKQGSPSSVLMSQRSPQAG